MKFLHLSTRMGIMKYQNESFYRVKMGKNSENKWPNGNIISKFDVHGLRISWVMINAQDHDPRNSYFMLKVMGP